MMTDPVSFEYTIIRKPRLRHLYLRIREGKLLISANKSISKKTIQQFIESKSEWIYKHLSVKKEKKQLTDDSATVYYLGKAFSVEIIKNPLFQEEKMHIGIQMKCLFEVKTTPSHNTLIGLRDACYKKACMHVISPIVESYAKSMQLYPQKIGYRHNRSRWGSCSSQNNLSLNSRLMMLPLTMITYVVIHELAHIKHKNHGSDFWLLVEQFSPDYKELRSGLREFESFL